MPIDPNVIGTLLSQQGGAPPPPGQGAGAIPPTTPVQPQAPPPQPGGGGMMAGMQMPDQQGQPQDSGNIHGALAEAVQAIQQARTHIQGLEDQISKVPNAPVGWKPNFQPVTGQGFGGDVKNLLGNIGKGAAVGLAGATPEGRSIMNTVQAPARAKRAQTISNLQEQIEAEKSSLGATGQEIGGLGMAARWNQAERGLDIKQQTADTAEKRVAAYSQHVTDQAKNFVATQDWRNAGLNEKTRNDLVRNAQAAADEAGRNYRANNRDATEEEVAGIITGTKKEIANQVSLEHPTFGSMLASWAGLPTAQNAAPSPEMRPTAPATPAKTTTQKAKGAAAPSGMKIGQSVTLKNGKTVKVTAVHPDGSFDAN